MLEARARGLRDRMASGAPASTRGRERVPSALDLTARLEGLELRDRWAG